MQSPFLVRRDCAIKRNAHPAPALVEPDGRWNVANEQRINTERIATSVPYSLAANVERGQPLTDGTRRDEAIDKLREHLSDLGRRLVHQDATETALGLVAVDLASLVPLDELIEGRAIDRPSTGYTTVRR